MGVFHVLVLTKPSNPAWASNFRRVFHVLVLTSTTRMSFIYPCKSRQPGFLTARFLAMNSYMLPFDHEKVFYSAVALE